MAKNNRVSERKSACVRSFALHRRDLEYLLAWFSSVAYKFTSVEV